MGATRSLNRLALLLRGSNAISNGSSTGSSSCHLFAAGPRFLAGCQEQPQAVFSSCRASTASLAAALTSSRQQLGSSAAGAAAATAVFGQRLQPVWGGTWLGTQLAAAASTRGLSCRQLSTSGGVAAAGDHDGTQQPQERVPEPHSQQQQQQDQPSQQQQEAQPSSLHAVPDEQQAAAAAPPPQQPAALPEQPLAAGASFGPRRVTLKTGRVAAGAAKREGIVHVNSTFNNTIIVLTDRDSKVKTWTSGGTVGYKNANKATPMAAELAAKELARRALELGFHSVVVKLKGAGKNKQFAVQALAAHGLTVTQLQDVTPIPYNGCRLPRRRRV